MDEQQNAEGRLHTPQLLPQDASLRVPPEEEVTKMTRQEKREIVFTLFFFLWSFGDEGENGLQVSCLVQRSLIV